MRRAPIFGLAFFLFGACHRAPAPSSPAAPAGEVAENCQRPQQREFDFWAGDWDVHIKNGTFAGHNRIEIAHGGCTLIEHWNSANGGGGTSTNYWDPVTKQWTQNWVDAAGSIIQLHGGLEGSAMVLVGRYAKPDGEELQMRGTWTPLEDGRVRQFFETRAEGEDWVPWFEGFYTRSP